MKIIVLLLALMLLIGSVDAMGVTSALNLTAAAKPGIVYFVGNASNNQTITLPNAATANLKGTDFSIFVNTDPGTHYFRLTATGGDLINGGVLYKI